MGKAKEQRAEYNTGRGEMILIPNNPYAPRICPELAVEIGLNESLLLLQIDFWIRTSNTEPHEGKNWTYQSVRDIQETFKFWSLATINRTIQSLVESKLILVGNFNKYKYDKTRWFSLNPEAIANLQSIHIGGYDTRSTQNETPPFQDDTRSTQDDTTIPETSTEITPEKKAVAAANIFTLYENLGLALNPLIKEELLEAEKDFPAAWIPEAFKRAAAQNVRKWVYIKRILDDWLAKGGIDDPKPPQPTYSQRPKPGIGRAGPPTGYTPPTAEERAAFHKQLAGAP
jgi:DnaD/phage-associated family protein